MTGDQWAAAHGDAWQNFLHKKLKKCECVHPATSNSNRAKVLKEEESLAQGEPAKCLVCFAPINMEVRRFPPPLPQPAVARGGGAAVAGPAGGVGRGGVGRGGAMRTAP